MLLLMVDILDDGKAPACTQQRRGFNVWRTTQLPQAIELLKFHCSSQEYLKLRATSGCICQHPASNLDGEVLGVHETVESLPAS